ncbi:MAG TPA: CocE/NonD family hydrolase [Candidatus Eisenbacteria bacterium]|nr:CocE/NonD family hydrolase [Candidatus Eisenbacteria bacterium]
MRRSMSLFLIVTLLAAAAVWAWSTGRVARLTLAVRILDELRRPGPQSWLRRATPAPQRSTITLEYGPAQLAADLYRPATGRKRAPVILVPGLVEDGKENPLVPPFAECLARAGFTVVVPDLHSFRTLRVHPDQVRELSAALDAVTSRPDLAPHGRAGVFGISYAGGIAMLVALDPVRAERVSFVAGVGAYADLDTALRFLATGRTFHRGRLRMVKAEPYGQLVFLRTYEEFLDDPEDVRVLEAMAQRRLADARAPVADLADSLSPEGRLIYDLFETASPEEVPRLVERTPRGLLARMAELSPGRREFGSLRARVHLVHDLNDGTFPASESHRLAELARPHQPAHVLVLEGLRHVEPQPWRSDPLGFLTRDLPEAAGLAWWWYRLLGEDGKE